MEKIGTGDVYTHFLFLFYFWGHDVGGESRGNLKSILLTVHGAVAWASATEPLTSGMVGIPVTIEYVVDFSH